LNDVDIFESDTESTTELLKYFLAFKIKESKHSISSLSENLEITKTVFKSQKLAGYYTKPVFHVSFAYFHVKKEDFWKLNEILKVRKFNRLVLQPSPTI
jgi:hypothetical protein